MSSRRLLKAAEAVRGVVSMAILTELRDPRVQNVTVTGVEVAPDMRTAKIQVSVMGTEGQQHMCLTALQRSAGFLQSKLAQRIDTRYTPRLTFELDSGVKKSLEMARILHELEIEREELAKRQAAEAGDSTAGAAAGGEHSADGDGDIISPADTTELDNNTDSNRPEFKSNLAPGSTTESDSSTTER